MTNRIISGMRLRGPISALLSFSVSSVVNLMAIAFSRSPLATRHSPLSLTIPAHPGGSPVTPIIPALTQNRGVGCVIAMVTYLKYVGAPTFSPPRADRLPPAADEQKDGPLHESPTTSHESRTTNHVPPRLAQTFTLGYP